MKIDSNNLILAGGIAAAVYFFTKGGSNKATTDELNAAGELLAVPQIQNWLQQNPPPTFNQLTSSGLSTPVESWGQAFGIFTKAILGPALANINLPAGTPEVVGKIYKQLVANAATFPSGNPFTRANIGNWINANGNTISVGTRNLFSNLFQ